MPSAAPSLRVLAAAAAAVLLLESPEALADSTSACFDAYESGQVLRRDGHLTDARTQFGVCASQDCPGVTRSDCLRWLEELRSAMPSIVVVARDGETAVTDARLVLDGNPVADRLDGRAFELDPGVRRVRVVRGDASSDMACSEPTRVCAEAEILVVVGERNRVVHVAFKPPVVAEPRAQTARAVPGQASPAGGSRVAPATPEPDARSASRPSVWGPIVLAGAGVVTAGVSVALWRGAETELHRLERRCAPFCTDEDKRALREELRMADVTAVSAAALLAGAGVLWLVKPSRAERSGADRLHLGGRALAGGGAVLILGGGVP